MSGKDHSLNSSGSCRPGPSSYSSILLHHIWFSDSACKSLMDQTLHKPRAADFPSQQKNALGKKRWRVAGGRTSTVEHCRGVSWRKVGQKVRECPGEMLADGGCREKRPGAWPWARPWGVQGQVSVGSRAGSSTGSAALSLCLRCSDAEQSPGGLKDLTVCLKKCVWCPCRGRGGLRNISFVLHQGQKT